MTSHLYVLSIGPVQDFIAAARRTRDLWFGSYLLSEISRAAAGAIADAGGLLIFPALAKEAREPQAPVPDKELEAFNVANIILAELPEGAENPQTVSEAAQAAAGEKWLEYAGGAKQKAARLVRNDIWNEQINDVIEFNAAWVPLEGGYITSRKRLMRLLAGRKSIRNFEPARGEHGVPKSSLDGARETVLIKDRKPYGYLALQLRLSEAEQLCAVGLTKRLAGGRPITFPSVTRVALDPWIRRIRKEGGDADRYLTQIGELCEGENSYASGTGKNLYQDFPYDGQVCYLPRLTELKKELKKVQKDDQSANSSCKRDLENLKQIEDSLRSLQKIVGEPNPYLAVLVADGDHMGRAISQIESADGHRAFSAKLSKFAITARTIVESPDSRGVIVYSGGDDVLAFLPVDTCLATARKLHEAFGAYGNGLTLSVGIAIGHKNDPLEDLLSYGRAAEKAAKSSDTAIAEPHAPIPGTERNGLALHLHTRSGGNPVKIREQWKPEGQNGMDERLATWVSLHINDALPDKAAYDLLMMAEEYQGWTSPVPIDLLEKDVLRLFKRKRAGHGTREVAEEDVGKLMEGIDSTEDLLRRAKELVIARRIAVAAKGGDEL